VPCLNTLIAFHIHSCNIYDTINHDKLCVMIIISYCLLYFLYFANGGLASGRASGLCKISRVLRCWHGCLSEILYAGRIF